MPHKDPESRQSPWNDLVEADLRTMSAAGKSSAEMAAFLNHKFKLSLTRSAIIGKRMRIGLCKPLVEVRALQEKVRRMVLPKPSKPPKPPKNEAASIDRVRRLQEVEIVEEIKPELIALDPKPIIHPDFGGCRWPLGLTEDGQRLHCCNPRGDLRPYCSDHKRLAYQTSRSPSQVAHDAKLRAASQRTYAEKKLFSRVNEL